MLKPILRTFKHFNFKSAGILMLCFSLIWTPQLTLAASISLQSGLSQLEMDLGVATLRVEKIDSTMQLATDQSGTLKVAHVRAKRVTVTMKENNKSSNNLANLLPNKINLPLPIIVQDALIDEIVIKNGANTTVLKHVALSLEANNKNLNIALSNITILVKQKPKDLPENLIEKYDAKLQLNIINQKPFKLDGLIELAQAQNTKQTATKAFNIIKVDLSGSLQHLHFSNKTALVKQGNQISIAPNTDKVDAIASIITDGEISLEGDYPLTLHASIQSLKPEVINNRLTGIVNLNVDVTGQLSPEVMFKVSTQSYGSTLNDLPFKLNSTFSVENNQLKAIDLLASLAKNQLTASGELGAADSVLSWNANFSDLSNLGAEFAGTVKVDGKITSATDTMGFQYLLSAEKLRLPNLIKVEKIDATGVVSTASNGAMQSDINIVGLTKNDSMPISATLALQGTQQKHSLTLTINNTNPDGQKLGLKSVISGGFSVIPVGKSREQSQWQGQIEKIDSNNYQSIHLAQAAPMQWSSEYGFSLKDFALNINQGKLLIESLKFTNKPNTIIQTKGHINHLALQDLPENILSLPNNMRQNLVLGGDWSINLADTIDADLKLWRDTGDILLIKDDDKTLTLGIENMQANVNIQHNNINADIHILGANFGALNAQITSVLSKDAQSFGLAASAPLKLAVDGQLKTLAWLPLPASMANAQSDGQLQLNMSADGTIAEPNLKGRVTGSQLSFTLPSQGVQLTNGVLQANFTDKTLAIKQLLFTGGQGTMRANGLAEFKEGKPTFDLNWRADQFTALSRTDRFLALNGTAKTQLSNHLLTINGDFKVINGLFELPKNTAPALGDDVVIVGKDKALSEASKKKTNANALKINIAALNIDFGVKPQTSSLSNTGTNISSIVDPASQFIIRGNGLDGFVTGAITLSGKPDATLNAKGSLDIGGTYLAYGQILDIETGTINFSGPIENAGLSILATRNTSPVKAGVQITGNLRIPTVKLVSTPEVSDSDKLSWLILGQPLDNAGESGLAVLSLAASTILSNGNSVPLQTRLARSAGFDSLNVSGSGVSTYSVSVGKRITPKLYLGYEKSLFGLLNIAKLTYNITKRISLVTRAGSDSAVDLLYTFSFD